MTTTPSYADWYTLPGRDFFDGNYTDVCEAFGEAGPDPASLLTNLATGTDQFGTFMLLTGDKIQVLHRVKRHLIPHGVPTTPFDGKTFATCNDVTELGPATILFPNDTFYRTAMLTGVRTVAGIDAALAADPGGPGQLDAAADGDPDTDNARTRLGMFVPPAYAAAVLAAASSPEGLTPRRLWSEIILVLRATAGHEVACASFLDWCRIAISHGTGANNPLNRSAPTLVMPDARLSSERLQILRNDLPLRFAAAPAAVTDLGLVVDALGGLRADADARGLARDAKEDAKKATEHLPSTRWRGPLDQVLNLCQVNDELELPPVWHDMARAGAKRDRATIQYHFKAQANLRGLDANRVPICSPELSKDLGALTFEPESTDDLKSGLSIFALCHPDQASTRRANELAGHYDSQMDGLTGLTMAESVALKAAQDLQLPTKYIQVKTILGTYDVALNTLMGSLHTFVVAYGLFVARVERMEFVLDLLLDGNVNRCTAFIQWVHVNSCLWFTALVRTEIHRPPPNFMKILDDIELQCWIPMTLPLAYRRAPAVTPSAPAVRGGGLAAALAPTAATRTPTTAAPATGEKRGYVRATAAELDPALTLRKNYNVKAHIEAHGPTPVNDAGGPMCLSFHVRGSCRHECERGQNSGAASDHKRHSTSETTRLKTYLDLAGPTAVLGGN